MFWSEKLIKINSNQKFYRKSKGESDQTGRFGIGTGFTQPPEVVTKTDPATQNPTSPNISPEKIIKDPTKFCKICDIVVTSNAQMKLHLEGSKHTKKLKLMGKLILFQTKPIQKKIKNLN